MDINQIFEGLELSEETVAKIATIYEAAVAEGLKEKLTEAEAKLVAEHEEKGAAHIAHLDEQFEAKGKELVEQYEAKVAELETHAEAYLTESVKTWISENRTEVVNMQRLQVMEDFVGKMRAVFAECQIDVPESEQSIAEDLAKQIAALTESQTVLTSRLQSLKEENQTMARAAVVSQMSEGLTMIQAEKLKSLAEEVKVDSISEFSEKLNTLKEAFIKPEGTAPGEPEKAPLKEEKQEEKKPAEKRIQSLQEQAKHAWRHGLSV